MFSFLDERNGPAIQVWPPGLRSEKSPWSNGFDKLNVEGDRDLVPH